MKNNFFQKQRSNEHSKWNAKQHWQTFSWTAVGSGSAPLSSCRSQHKHCLQKAAPHLQTQIHRTKHKVHQKQTDAETHTMNKYDFSKNIIYFMPTRFWWCRSFSKMKLVKYADFSEEISFCTSLQCCLKLVWSKGRWDRNCKLQS